MNKFLFSSIFICSVFSAAVTEDLKDESSAVGQDSYTQYISIAKDKAYELWQKGVDAKDHVLKNFKEDVSYAKNSIIESISHREESKYWKSHMVLGALVPVAVTGIYNFISEFTPLKKCVDIALVIGFCGTVGTYIYKLYKRGIKSN